MQIIESLSPGQLDLFRHIERQWRGLLKEKKIYAEGERVFAALLQSQIRIFTVIITPDLLEKYQNRLNERELELLVAGKSSIENLIQRRLNQGVVAVAEMPEMPPLETVLQKECCCIVALNGIDHAVNVGSIMRNCAAFGVSAVLFDEATIHPYCWRAIKASIGGTFRVPIHPTRDLLPLLKMMQQNQFELIAADPAGPVPLSELKAASKTCLLLGSEHAGISPNILELQPARVSIPVKNVDSLNVAAASAIFLHQISLLSRNHNDGQSHKMGQGPFNF